MFYIKSTNGEYLTLLHTEIGGLGEVSETLYHLLPSYIRKNSPESQIYNYLPQFTKQYIQNMYAVPFHTKLGAKLFLKRHQAELAEVFPEIAFNIANA